MNIDNIKEEWVQIQQEFKQTLKLGLDPKDESRRAIFEATIYWCAKLYMHADWKKIARNKNVYREDVFEHVIKAAGSQPNIRRINDRICEDLGLQSVKISSEIFDFLENNRKIVIQFLRKEPVYFSLKAIELADFLFKRIKNGEKNEPIQN